VLFACLFLTNLEASLEIPHSAVEPGPSISHPIHNRWIPLKENPTFQIDFWAQPSRIFSCGTIPDQILSLATMQVIRSIRDAISYCIGKKQQFSLDGLPVEILSSISELLSCEDI
jgi:hypothetical protein